MSLVSPEGPWDLKEPLSLYIHVPFCRKKCGYCAFFSCDSFSLDQQKSWLDHLLTEWSTFLPLIQSRGVASVYFGGGTPSLVNLDIWNTLLQELNLPTLRNPSIPLSRYATVEVNPGTLSLEKLNLWSQGGVGRLSLGIQSFDPKVLHASGRLVNPGETEGALELVKSHWSGEWSLDLIAGLPGQTHLGILQDLKKALEWAPDHLALYEYIQEEGTPLDESIRQGLNVPGDELRQLWWLEGRNYLEAQGYENYEISNFALPGKQAIHNLAYWEMSPCLGLGPGAVSLLPTRDGWVRFSNPETWDWSGNSQSPWGNRNVEKLSPQEHFQEILLTGLRLQKGLSKSRFEFLTGKPWKNLWKGVNSLHQKYYREDSETWGLTEEGRDRLDWLLQRYDTSWINS